ncbi:MAG: hypothetical protein EOM45_14005 [Clostridia bacterium]|nr:hypothetical protein [Clostridia bacterium]
MKVEVYSGNEKMFESDITRYSIAESRMVVDLVGGFVDTTFQNNKLYRIFVIGTDEVIEKFAEFISYNYNVQSSWKYDQKTGALILDEDGNHIVEYRRGENSLLFKVF